MIQFQKLIAQKKRIFRSSLVAIVLLILCIPHSSKASHIIGGEMNYTCMGGDNYEITLTVYRDCFYANPLAVFDDPAAIGIFDSDNNLVDTLMLHLMNNDTLTPILSDSCLFVPSDVCVHTTTYRRTVNLPFRMGGYTFAYQRCCRNQTITNIVDPANTGATFQVTLSERALIECNNGAEFMDWPPLFICVNEPIYWDHSATDPEGDSLVYRLCTPNDGADFVNNKPQPPNPPPYGNVTWTGPYDENNLLGGDPLTIDPNTGILTGTPNTVGQFVVGVCIEEYRDGELIAFKTRDFQYNVGQCLEVNPQVGNDLVQCGDLAVEFINTSENANNFLWMFGDPNNPDSISTAFEPTYDYPDTGFYDITLIAEPDGACADTLTQTMYLKESTLTSEFSYLILNCSDSVILSTANTSFDTYSNIIEYQWELSDGQTSNEENPVFAISETDELTLTLTAVADDGCQENFSETFLANVLGDGEIADTLFVCPGGSINLNNSPFLGTGIVYEWSPATNLSSTTAANPVASPSENTIYEVSLMDTINNCTGGYRVLVQIQENGGAILIPDTTFCSSELLIQADSNAIVSMNWSADADFSTSLGTTSSIIVSGEGTQMYYLAVEDELGCNFVDSIQVTGAATAATPNFDIELVSCDEEQYVLNFIDATQSFTGDIIGWNWEFDNGFTFSEQNPTFTLTGNNISSVILTIRTANCEITQELPVDLSPYIIDASAINGNQSRCSADPFGLNPNGNSTYTYQWSPANAVDDATSFNPLSTTTESTVYTVTISNSFGCEVVREVSLDVAEDLLDADFSWMYSDCIEEAVVNFETNPTYSGGAISEISWTYGNETNSTTNFTTTFDSDQELIVTLSVVAEDGCTATRTETLNIGLLDLDLTPTQYNCNQNGLQLNTGGNPNYTYSWSPAVGLSDATAAMPFANPETTTEYAVTVFDQNSGCEITQAVMIEVPENLDAALEVDYSDCTGPALGNFVNTTQYSSAITNVQWIFDGAAPVNETSPSFSFDENTSVNTQLVVQAENGCTDTLQQMVDINIISFEVPSDNVVICGGNPTELNPNPNPNLQYAWSPNIGINNMGTSNPLANPEETTTYVVTITDNQNGGCSVEQTVVAEVPNYEINVNFEVENIECEDELMVQFQNASTFGNNEIVAWEWTFSTGQTSQEEMPILSITQDMQLTVQLEVMIDDGCTYSFDQPIAFDVAMTDLSFMNNTISACANTPISLNADANTTYQYEWEGAGISNANAMNPVVEVSESTEYTVTVTNFNGLDTCEIVRTINVDVEAADLSFLPDNVLACEGGSVNLNENAQGNFTYNWNPSISLDDGSAVNPMATPLETTTYNVTITNQDGVGGCEYITAVTAIVGDPPALEIAGDEINCGEEAMLSAITNPTFGIQWSDDANFENIISEEVAINVTTAISGTDYFVQVTDQDGCTNVQSITVYDRAVDIELLEMETICFGDTFEIQSINLDPNDELNYLWSPSSTIVSGQGTESIQFIADDNTTFALTATNQYGCETTETIDLDVIDLSNFVEIISDTDTIISGEEVQLMVNDNFGVAYEWAPAIYLDDPNSATPIAMLEESTMFIASVQDENGCVGTASHLVVVLPSTCEEPFVFIPNSFSPNGDDRNEVLYVQGHPIEEMHLVIFNRWGQQVFESNSKEIGWDGTYKGKMLEPDVFGFYLEVKCFNGEEYFKKGNITLLR